MRREYRKGMLVRAVVDLARSYDAVVLFFAKRATRLVQRSVLRGLSPTRERHTAVSPFNLKETRRQSPGSLLWFRLLSLAQERPRRLVIGHVLLRRHARNGAADHVESQVLQRFEADATFTHVELLAALLIFAGEPG